MYVCACKCTTWGKVPVEDPRPLGLEFKAIVSCWELNRESFARAANTPNYRVTSPAPATLSWGLV